MRIADSDSDTDAILVINSGSSSLKASLYPCRPDASAPDQDEQALFEGMVDGIGRDGGRLSMHSSDGAVQLDFSCAAVSQSQALRRLADSMAEHYPHAPVAVAHRLVHGGPHLREHQALTPEVFQALQAAVHFAPLHLPSALALIQEAQGIFSTARHFACFDNAFHRTLPPVAAHLPLPRRYFEAGVIRYGFHGLSYASIVRRLGHAIPPRAVFAHLGSGASVCAVKDGISIDTSMGLTPTGGIPMGTRSGDLDPGVLLYLMRNESMDADALEKLVNSESGLAGLADGESDMQALCKRSEAGDAGAMLALDVFTTAVRKTIGAYAALMGGIDLLVFTGGIGEHSVVVRRRICDGLQFLGLLESDGARVRVMPTGENFQMVLHCRGLLET